MDVSRKSESNPSIRYDGISRALLKFEFAIHINRCNALHLCYPDKYMLLCLHTTYSTTFIYFSHIKNSSCARNKHTI